jgi:hypothetical protein
MKTERGASRGRRRCVVQWQHKGGIEMNVVGMRGPDSGTMTTRLAGVLLRVELVVVAGTFFVFALLHLGIRLAGLAEPRILPATIVEAVCGLCMALAAAATFAGTPRAWRAAVTAHVISMAGSCWASWPKLVAPVVRSSMPSTTAPFSSFWLRASPFSSRGGVGWHWRSGGAEQEPAQSTINYGAVALEWQA